MDADTLLRRALALPGRVLDLADAAAGRPRLAGGLEPDAVLPLVRRQARHPESHLALEPGLSYVVAHGHVLAYRLRGGTAFGVGGVNAPPGERGPLLAAFAAQLRARGCRRVLLFPLRRDELDEARAAGFDAVQVGVEAWLDLPGLDLGGREHAHVRHLRNVARRRGVRVDELGADDARALLPDVYAAWLASKRPRWRMRLLVGTPGFERAYDRRYLVARGEDRVEGFVTLVPGGPGVWGVDVMCRRPDAIKGTMEALVVAAAERLRDEGATALSLGPCPMAAVPVQGPRSALRRTFALLYGTRCGNRLFGFRNLHRFKQKFRPRWEPVWFGATPRLGVTALYAGCRMWGLFP